MSDDSLSIHSNRTSHAQSQSLNQEPVDCHCDANLFYKKYKAKIESLLNKQLADKEELLAEQTKSVSGVKKSSLDSKRSSDVRKSSTGTISKNKEKKERKSKEHGRQETKGPEDYVQEERGQRGGDHIQLKKKKESVKVSVAKEEHDKKADIIYSHATELTSFETSKSVEYSIGSEEVRPEHVEFYATALDEKLHQIFEESGGEESLGQTERGYYIFDRYYVAESEQSTVNKMLSGYTASVEGEDLFTYHAAEPVEEEWMSESMKQALEYLKKHKIQDLFKYLGAQLVATNPCNPIDFLVHILDNCLNYRLGYCEPPLLYQPKHVESLFHSMDPMGTGLIEMNQYHMGMYTMGITSYNMFPETIKNNMVQKKIFVNEALNQLTTQLNEMIQNFGTPLTAASQTTSVHYFSALGETVTAEQQ